MKKFRIIRSIALIASLIMLVTSTVQTTLAFIVTKTESIVNTFVPVIPPSPEDLVLSVTVEKTVVNTGTIEIGPENFAFVLENTDDHEQTVLRTDTSGKAVFSLVYTEDDAEQTFRYKLYETDEGVEGVTYDPSVYEIEIAVTLDENNQLGAVILQNSVEVESCVATFENTYHANKPVDPPAPPTGDNAQLIFWLTMMLVSATASVVLLLVGRRSKAKTNQ